MKKLGVAAVVTVMLLGLQAYGDSVTSINVVGVMGLEIAGGGTDTYTLLAAPMTKLPVTRGAITANTTTTITDGNAAWDAGAFAVGGNAVAEDGDSTYYVEITSGALVGRHFYIAGNDATTLTLAAAMTDVVAGDLDGASYKIIPANRVRDIFGEPGSQVLAGAADPAGADNVLLMNPAGWSDPIYYKNAGFPVGLRNNWVQSGVAANDLVVDRDIGVLVLRKAGGSAVQLQVTGEVSANAQAVVVEPGFSLLGGMSAVAVAIADSGLIDVMAGGADPAGADNLYAWTGTGWSDPVYYKNAGFPVGLRDKWVQSGVDVGSTFMIEPGVAYLLKKAGQANDWVRQSPLAAAE